MSDYLASYKVKENIHDFRIRKIKWDISELLAEGGHITPYKVQLFAGFDGSDKKIRKLVLIILGEFVLS